MVVSLPRILIPIPTSFDEVYNAKSWPEYAAAVSGAGGAPVQLALTHSPGELQALVEGSAGVLLPGSGADVDPARYGHDRDPASAPSDTLREVTDRAILESAARTHKPLLGICLGLQSLNVYYGGTLIQDLDPVPVNHRAGRSVAVAHAAVIDDSSRLGFLLGAANGTGAQSGRIPVNSSHHQAVGTPGDTLRVVARCPEDGVIEALEGVDPAHWLVGVQWHPERTFHSSGTSAALFAAFLNASSSAWPS